MVANNVPGDERFFMAGNERMHMCTLHEGKTEHIEPENVNLDNLRLGGGGSFILSFLFFSL